jgi:hypothetical protein
VLDDVGAEGADDAQLVGHLAQVREQLADLQPRPPAAAEAERRAQQRQPSGAAQVHAGHGAAVVARQARLRVEGVEVRNAAGEEDEDQLAGPRLVVRPPRGEHLPVVQAGGQGEGRVQPQPARGTAFQEIAPAAHRRLRKRSTNLHE